jgi:hypothetical protein
MQRKLTITIDDEVYRGLHEADIRQVKDAIRRQWGLSR